MKQFIAALWIALLPALALAGDATPPADAISIEATALGDADGGIVTRITMKIDFPDPPPADTPLVIQGSFLHDGAVVKNFRLPLPPDSNDRAVFIQTLPAGDLEVEAKVIVPLEETAPMILAKSTKKVTIAATGHAYVADANDGVEAFVAEGTVPESSGAVKIRAPRRDLAPNLFKVQVDVRPPVQKVEFYVDDKKIFTKNAPPYETELDLGTLPKRVEVKVVGYDKAGRYIDADAWVVNERDSQLEAKLTRTVTPDGVSHVKLSVQNPKNRDLKTIELYAGDRKIFVWRNPPYAVDLPAAQLKDVQFLRASVTDDTSYEATDLLFLDGSRFGEQIDVNLVELPVSVTAASGGPIVDLKEGDFTILEDKKPQKISSFGFATNLPISVGVLVDHSGSMKPRLEAAKKAAIAFFSDIIGPKDHAFYGSFSWDPNKISPFVTDVASLREQAQATPEAEGGTALYDAIVSGLYRFRSVAGRKALVVVTDGEDTTSRLTYDDMLSYARGARVPIYFIGIGIGGFMGAGSGTMKSLAAETGGVAYFIKGVDQLKETYDTLEKDLRSQYLLTYYAQSSKDDHKYRTIEVQTSRPGAKVRTIRGFLP